MVSYVALNTSPQVLLSVSYAVTRASGEKPVVKMRARFLGSIVALLWG